MEKRLSKPGEFPLPLRRRPGSAGAVSPAACPERLVIGTRQLRRTAGTATSTTSSTNDDDST
jgi:hypothetical protein